MTESVSGIWVINYMLQCLFIEFYILFAKLQLLRDAKFTKAPNFSILEKYVLLEESNEAKNLPNRVLSRRSFIPDS